MTMNEKKTTISEETKAFGMSFEEFSEFYNEIGGFTNEYNKNHQYINNDESLLNFVCDGCDDLLNENNDVISSLI